MSIITVDALTQSYPLVQQRGVKRLLGQSSGAQKTVLRELSFSVENGGILGVFGLEGAGKTTLLRVLSGAIAPTAGEVTVLDFSAAKERKKLSRYLGVMPSPDVLPADMPLVDYYADCRARYGIPARAYEARLAELSAMLDTQQAIHSPAKRLSRWTQTKCACIAAMLHRPALVLMDEPCRGLLPEEQAALRAFIEQINAQEGTTFVIATTAPEDVTALAKQVLVLERGRALFSDDRERFCRAVGARRIVELTLAEPNRLYGIPGAKLLTQHSELDLVLEVDVSRTTIPQFLEKLGGRLKIEDVAVRPVTAEQLLATLREKA